MKTLMKAFLISASIAGLTNLAAVAADIKTGLQEEAPCSGVADGSKKAIQEEGDDAKKKKSSAASAAKGGGAQAPKN